MGGEGEVEPKRVPVGVVALLVTIAVLVPFMVLARQTPPHIWCTNKQVEVCEAITFVEEVRGRGFKEEPVVSLLTKQAADLRIAAEYGEFDQHETSGTSELFRLFGVVEPDVDLEELLDSPPLFSGLYLPHKNEVILVAEEMTLLTQAILVHELTHAFDYQWIDGLGQTRPTSFDERLALGAAIEGNAMRVEYLWVDKLSGADQEKLFEEGNRARSAAEADQLAALPEFYLQVNAFPYTEGEKFATWIHENGGEEAIDEMLENPPETSEQVLEPEAWETGESAVSVPKPRSGFFDPYWTDTLGQMGISVLLGDAAGEGWGGDQYALWKTESQTCGELVIEADTFKDKGEMMVSARELARQRQHIEVMNRGDSVVMKACLDSET